jgi:hypothetical protein
MSEDFVEHDKMLQQARIEKIDPFEIARKDMNRDFMMIYHD